MGAPAFAAALRADAEGVLIDVDVAAGARDARFPDGFNPWRVRLGVRVTAAAREGRANEEVRRLLAGFFGIRPEAVIIRSGRTSSQKTVHVAGIDRGDALARVERALA